MCVLVCLCNKLIIHNFYSGNKSSMILKFSKLTFFVMVAPETRTRKASQKICALPSNQTKTSRTEDNPFISNDRYHLDGDLATTLLSIASLCGFLSFL